MGIRGPLSKKSAEENARRGNPGKRKLPVEQNSTTSSTTAAAINLLVPEKPNYLTAAASQLWDDILPKMLTGDSIRSVDAHLLADYCNVTAEMIKLQSFLKSKGMFKKNSNNTKTKREEVGMLSSLRKEQLKLADVLGLTPKSRKQQNINLKQPQVKDASATRKSRILGE